MVVVFSNKVASPKHIEVGNLKLGLGVGATTTVLLIVESQKCGPKSEYLTEKVMKLSKYAEVAVRAIVPAPLEEGEEVVYSEVGTTEPYLVVAIIELITQVEPWSALLKPVGGTIS
jgi:hypothetical protein